MKNQPLKPGHGGPVPEPQTFSVPKRMQEDECMGRSRTPYMVTAAIFMFLCLAIMFGFILLRAQTKRPYGTHKLEPKMVGDLNSGLEEALASPKFRSLSKKHPDLAGQEFWELLIRERAVDEYLLSKLASLKSTTDRRPERDDFLSGTEPSDPWCSFTAPRMGQLAELKKRTGEDHVVLVTFNSRNWNNYPGRGVIVLWSDRKVGEFLDFETAEDDYGITAEEWADPAGKLFGKKAPFQFTYE
ncbi:MAG: hypothetical protein ICCCNLDF_02344 [Planctomycetes bacterium]|nr:hypothetical protein [Planctomycetota bacterium]